MAGDGGVWGNPAKWVSQSRNGLAGTGAHPVPPDHRKSATVLARRDLSWQQGRSVLAVGREPDAFEHSPGPAAARGMHVGLGLRSKTTRGSAARPNSGHATQFGDISVVCQPVIGVSLARSGGPVRATSVPDVFSSQ